MKFVKHGFQLSLVAALLALCSGAHAATSSATIGTTSGNLLTGTNRSVTDSNGAGTADDGATTVTQSATTGNISQFNSANGVLTGVTGSVTVGSNSQYLRLDQGTKSAGSVSVIWNAGGAATSSQTVNSVANTTTGDNTWATFSQVAFGNINSFVGTGSVAGSFSTTLSATRTTQGQNRTASVTTNFGQATNLGFSGAAITYTSLGHASGTIRDAATAAGASITYDFGKLGSGTSASHSFDILNGSGLYGLRIASIGCADTNAGNGVDDCALFNIANTFANVAGGSFAGGAVTFAGTSPNVFTNYSATFTLNMADTLAGTGATNSLDANRGALTVNVMAAVPEPESYAMLLAGLGAMGFMGRRRNRASKA